MPPPNPNLEAASPSLLSPAAYDDDASLRSPSDQDSDSEDDEYLSRSRTTLELAQHDRAVLDDEEELEKLLTRQPPSGIRRIFSPGGSSVRIGGRDRKRKRQRSGREGGRRRQYGEAKMEEGYRDDDSVSLLGNEDADDDDDEDYGGREKDGFIFAQV